MDVDLGHVHLPEPGQPCALCKRRVPHPKKPDSPKTRVFSFRVPAGEVDTFTELADAATEYLGAKGRPHDRFWAFQFALVALLQASDFAGALARVEK